MLCLPSSKKSIDYDRLAISRQFHRSNWLCQSGKRLVFKSYLIVIWFQWSLGLGEQDENLFFQKPKDPGWSGYSFSATYTPTNRWKPFLSNNYHTLYQTLFKELKPRIYHSFPHPVKFDGTVVQYGTTGIQWYTVVQYPGPTEPAFGKALACFPPLAFQVSINGCQSGSSRAKSSDWGLKASAIDRNDDRRHMKRYIMDFKDSWWSPDLFGQSLTWANIFGAKSKCQSNHSKEMGPKPLEFPSHRR